MGLPSTKARSRGRFPNTRNLSSATTSENPTGLTEGPSAPGGSYLRGISQRKRLSPPKEQTPSNRYSPTATAQPQTGRAHQPRGRPFPAGGRATARRPAGDIPGQLRPPSLVEAARECGTRSRVTRLRTPCEAAPAAAKGARLPGFPRCQPSFSDRPPNKRGRGSAWAARGAGKRCTRAVGPFPRPPAYGPGLARPRQSPSIFSARGRKRGKERRRADGRPALAGGGGEIRDLPGRPSPTRRPFPDALQLRSGRPRQIPVRAPFGKSKIRGLRKKRRRGLPLTVEARPALACLRRLTVHLHSCRRPGRFARASAQKKKPSQVRPMGGVVLLEPESTGLPRTSSPRELHLPGYPRLNIGPPSASEALALYSPSSALCVFFPPRPSFGVTGYRVFLLLSLHRRRGRVPGLRTTTPKRRIVHVEAFGRECARARQRGFFPRAPDVSVVYGSRARPLLSPGGLLSIRLEGEGAKEINPLEAT